MRREALDHLVCPICRAPLTLSAGAREEGDHVMAGWLACTGPAGHRFPVHAGVPVLLPDDATGEKHETAARFAEEWTRWWQADRAYYEAQFLDWIAPLSRDAFAGAVVFEGGCGKGRHTRLAAGMGARAVVALDLGASVDVAFTNTRDLPTVHVVRGDLLAPPVRSRAFDVCFSVGVLHHLPDPAAGFRSLAGLARVGGRVACWVYGREGNEWIVRYVDPLRAALTARMSPEVLRTLTWAPSVPLWVAARVFGKARAAGKLTGSLAAVPYATYLAAMGSFPLDEIHSIVFDQMVTPISHYLPGDEVRAWFAGDGFADITVRSHRGYSWTGVARVT